ncbi:MAG: GntR family transcriptional regulator [Pirellulales bacterium]
MFFQIEPHNGLAVYDQIVRQLKFAVAEGALEPGELAPSVRELAKELAINPNTVARAYRQLQDDGVLETVRGTGLAVTKTAKKLCRDARRELVAARVGQVVAEAIHSGLDAGEVEKLFRAELKKFVNFGKDNR